MRRWEFAEFGRRPRAARVDPAALWQDAGTDTHIPRVLREYQTALRADELPNP